MTRQEVIDFFEKRGYNEYSLTILRESTVVWNGEKRQTKRNVPNCECNDRPPSFHVIIHDWEIANDPYHRDFKSIEIEIVGEKHGQWFNLKCYSINWNNLEKQISVAESCLLNAWIATAG